MNGQTYQWDDNGNLLNDGTSTYTYDAANRLTSVTQGTSLSSYSYNGLGDRLSQTVDSVTTSYVLDLNAGLTQVLADGTNTYLYGNGRIGELQPGGFAYHLGDALGSVRQLTDASGGVTLARSYEPYGSELSSVGTGSTVMSFTGEMVNAYTELTYLRARWYRSYLNLSPRFWTVSMRICAHRAGFSNTANAVESKKPARAQRTSSTRPSSRRVECSVEASVNDSGDAPAPHLRRSASGRSGNPETTATRPPRRAQRPCAAPGQRGCP